MCYYVRILFPYCYLFVDYFDQALFITPSSVDEYVFNSCKNIYGIVKLLLLKTSVGLIVIQGLVAQFLYDYGASPFNDDSTYNAQEKTMRSYCTFIEQASVIIIVIYVLCFFLCFAFFILYSPGFYFAVQY